MNSVLIFDDDRELCEPVAGLPADEGFRGGAVNCGDEGLECALSG